MTACFIDSGLEHGNFLNYRYFTRLCSNTIKVWWDN